VARENFWPGNDRCLLTVGRRGGVGGTGRTRSGGRGGPGAVPGRHCRPAATQPQRERAGGACGMTDTE
jgi:hypothetical protein